MGSESLDCLCLLTESPRDLRQVQFIRSAVVISRDLGQLSEDCRRPSASLRRLPSPLLLLLLLAPSTVSHWRREETMNFSSRRLKRSTQVHYNYNNKCSCIAFVRIPAIQRCNTSFLQLAENLQATCSSCKKTCRLLQLYCPCADRFKIASGTWNTALWSATRNEVEKVAGILLRGTSRWVWKIIPDSRPGADNIVLPNFVDLHRESKKQETNVLSIKY